MSNNDRKHFRSAQKAAAQIRRDRVASEAASTQLAEFRSLGVDGLRDSVAKLPDRDTRKIFGYAHPKDGEEGVFVFEDEKSGLVITFDANGKVTNVDLSVPEEVFSEISTGPKTGFSGYAPKHRPTLVFRSEGYIDWATEEGRAVPAWDIGR